jgi:hypothetical protein
MIRHDEDQDTSHYSDCDEVNQCGCTDCKERRKLQDAARDALAPLQDISSPTSNTEHTSHPGSDCIPIQDWLSEIATPPLLPHPPDHGKNSYDLWALCQEHQENATNLHLSNKIDNGIEPEFLDWKPGLTASLNDGNGKESSTGSSEVESSQQGQTASTQQGGKGKQPRDLTSFETNPPETQRKKI